MTRPAHDKRRPGIEDFDAHDGLMPASLRPLFVPSGDVRDGERDHVSTRGDIAKLVALAACFMPLLLLAGCGAEPRPVETEAWRAPIGNGISYKITVWQDPETGCEYIIGNDAMIPRLDADGEPMCAAIWADPAEAPA